MRLLVSIDEHYVSDGSHVYTTQGTTPYDFFSSEYLEVFEEVMVLARVRQDSSFAGREEAIADGPKVSFLALPEFKSPFQYLPVRRELNAVMRKGIAEADAYLMRGPGVLGALLAKELERTGKRYATQVIQDPWEVFGAGRVGGWLRPLYRQLLTRNLKHICEKAIAVGYVTRSALQQRYPASSGAFTSAWSDVRIQEGLASEEQLRARLTTIFDMGARIPRLGFVGNLEQPYKGADFLLQAVAECRKNGTKVEVELAGDGKFRGEYERMAGALGISGQVRFLGRLGSGKAIFDFLDSIDLFVMPSLAEGLPRAMIEAMARGCPCIGSRIGGIPELLEGAQLVEPGNPIELARKIVETLSAASEMARLAMRNRDLASRYTPEHANAARLAFLHVIRQSATIQSGMGAGEVFSFAR